MVGQLPNHTHNHFAFIIGQQYCMDRQNRNNRSLLALAGENSLVMHSSKSNNQPSIAKLPQSDFAINKSNLRIKTENPTTFDPKQIVKKLGLARLRKMQALVRGFLVRRKVYPKQLEEYLVAQSAFDLLVANVIYRQVSGIVVQTVTLGHYDRGQGGEDRLIEEYLYNAVIKRVIEKEFAPIARQAVYETAIYASRPQITFGFNLRDPLELTLYLKLNSIIEEECRGLVEDALREQALQRRQLQIIDSLILDMAVITDICHEVVDECLLEGVEDYAVEQMLSKITKEAAMVVAEVVYNQQVLKIQNNFMDSLTEQAEQWLLQQFMLTLICNPKKLQPNYE